MQNRDGMRPRQIDDNRPFRVIKDIEIAKKTFPPEEKKEIEKIEIYLKKVIKHFDNRKKILIPKSNIFENNNLNNSDKNDKKEKNDKKQNIKNINSDMPVYELKEYKRPDNYIIYSSKERDQPKTKDYEGKYSDQIFLNYHSNFMNLEVLESIISTLENNIGKGEKIPDEMAKKIIEDNFSKYQAKSDLIIKHFNDRRNELKKSLLRKYWRLQKSTDKFFATTFRRREREKMKIRKNNQKKEESFEKVKMAGELCKTHLLEIINAMKEKEFLNKKMSLIENIKFLSEINKIQKNCIPIEYINQNNEIISSLKGKGITINENIMHLGGDKDLIKELNDNQIFNGEGGTPSTKSEILKEDSKKNYDESHLDENKNIPQELVYPPINFDHFNFLKKKVKKEAIKNYRVRIRFNRIKKITVDRYIQKENSMDSFDDDYNKTIMIYQKYNPNLIKISINNTYESLIKEYYEQKYKFLEFLSDTNEDYDSFIKSKRNNKRLINKKRINNK